MKLRLPILAALCVAAASQSAGAAAILRITEVMSNGDTADWFEVTNLGDTAGTLTNYRMDDDSAAIGNSVELLGISSIAAGQSVIFIEGTSTTVSTFRSNWNLSGSVLVGTYSGSGVSLGSGGDLVVLFTNTSANGGVELTRVTVPAATAGTTFTYTYDASGTAIGGGVLTTGGMTGNNGATALRGTPGAVPEPSSMLLGLVGTIGLLRRRRA